MKWTGAGINGIVLKATAVALTLFFGVSLVGASAFADLGCGWGCCCQPSRAAMHHGAAKQLRSSATCCPATSKIPCDLQSDHSSKLPEYNLSSAGVHLPYVVGPIAGMTASRLDCNIYIPTAYFQPVPENSQSPPLYLQKLSLRI